MYACVFVVLLTSYPSSWLRLPGHNYHAPLIFILPLHTRRKSISAAFRQTNSFSCPTRPRPLSRSTIFDADTGPAQLCRGLNLDGALAAGCQSFHCWVSHTAASKGQTQGTGVGKRAGPGYTHYTTWTNIPVAESTALANNLVSVFVAGPKTFEIALVTLENQALHEVAMPDEEDNGRPFSCPFYVRDRHAWRNCMQHSFKRICDVRQHIRRIHLQRRHCPTCGQTFEDDPNDTNLNRHIAARRCQRQDFYMPGITADQDRRIAAIRDQGSVRRPAAQRWFEMWRVIFPGTPAPASPYSSSEPVFIQRLLDICTSIRDGEIEWLVPRRLWANIERHRLIISDEFINLARLLESGADGATPLYFPTQTSYEIPVSVQVAHGNDPLGTIPGWSASPSNQSGHNGTTSWAADTQCQGQDYWSSTGNAFVAEGPTQTPTGPASSWDALSEQPYLPHWPFHPSH